MWSTNGAGINTGTKFNAYLLNIWTALGECMLRQKSVCSTVWVDWTSLQLSVESWEGKDSGWHKLSAVGGLPFNCIVCNGSSGY